MTVESDIASLGELLANAEAAFQDEKRSHEDTLEDLGYALDRASTAEQELSEVNRVLADVRDRNVELEVMYRREVGDAAMARNERDSARAELAGLRGRR